MPVDLIGPFKISLSEKEQMELMEIAEEVMAALDLKFLKEWNKVMAQQPELGSSTRDATYTRILWRQQEVSCRLGIISCTTN